MKPPDFDVAHLSPRFLVVANRRWMETYHWFEQQEEAYRREARSSHSPDLLIWLRCLTLYRQAFTQTYYAPEDGCHDTEAAQWFRLDLLGLSGSTSKLAVDALVVGYYTQCFALIRHLIESWRRVLFIRLSPPGDIWRWFPEDMVPDAVKADPEYSRQAQLPKYKEIEALVQERGSEEDKSAFDKLSYGFQAMNDHAHPSLEGTTQVWGPEEGRRVFGPTYSRPHVVRGLKWGLAANLKLLEEVARIKDQGDSWAAELNAAIDCFIDWLQDNQGEEDVDAEQP